MRKIIPVPVLAALLGMTILFAIFPCCGRAETPIKKMPQPSPLRKTDYVNLQEYIPSLLVDLAYYTENNFTGQKLYDSPVACLRKGTADKLKAASEEAGLKGCRLKIWDAYRPPRVQFKMWSIYPNPRFLADPHKGFSDHSRGCAVDLTLVDTGGKELDMPSAFDEFTSRADRDYRDVTPAQKANALYLEKVMARHGLIPIRTEWWHFADSERKSYGVTDQLPPLKPLPARSAGLQSGY